MLPREKEPHELRRRHWRDFGTQAVECVPVNARQQHTIAPFDGMGSRGEHATQHGAVGLEGQQSGVRVGGRYTQ